MYFISCFSIENYYFCIKNNDMTTLTFQIDINEQLATAYHQAAPAEKSRIQQQVNALLERALLRETARKKMYFLLDELHAEAKSNGLTDDILAELLADEE